MTKFSKSKRHLSLFCLFIFFSAISTAQPPGWTHIKQVNVTENSGTTLINYQVKLTINTAALVAAGQMNANGSDIRFGKDPAGNVLYHYWIDTAMNTTSTVIWVKVDTLYASQVRTMYMFYGNTGAAVASNITGTLIGPFSSMDSQTAGTSSGNIHKDQLGYRFSPNEPIVVTEFGKYEPTGSTRYVTLFDFTSQAILQQVLVSGAASQYHYAPLANRMWMDSGVQYLIEIYQDSVDWYYDRSTNPINSLLTYYDIRHCLNCTQNTFPTSIISSGLYGYPDFLFYTRQIVSIEPTSTVTLYLSAPSPVIQCAGASSGITIGDTASGAQGTVTYRWSPTAGLSDSTSAFTVFTGSSSQSYTLSATDTSGNTSTTTVQVNVVQPSLKIDTISICHGGSYVLNGHTYTSGGNYIDTLLGGSSFGCDSIIILILKVNSLPSPVISQSGLDTLKTGNFSSYQWLLSNGQLAGATHSALVALSSGSYRVFVIDSNGCSDTSAVFNYVKSGISEPSAAADLKIYPNPNTGNFSLIIPAEYVGSQIIILDVIGREVQSVRASQERENIDMADLPGGIYMLNIGQSTIRFTVVK
jgi:hypothetical protein